MLDTRIETLLEERAFDRGDLRALRVLQDDLGDGGWDRRLLIRWLLAPGVEARVFGQRALPRPAIAFYVLHLPSPGEVGDAYLANFGVARAWRRRGVGTHALRSVERRARERGARRIALHVQEQNLAAQLLYRSMGYAAVRIERGGYGDQDAYRMVRELG